MSRCVIVKPGRCDSVPEIVFKHVPDCKHILVVTDPLDILTRSFCYDYFGGKDGYTCMSVVHSDPKLHTKILDFVNTYTEKSSVLIY
jgi:hypothetical protein